MKMISLQYDERCPVRTRISHAWDALGHRALGREAGRLRRHGPEYFNFIPHPGPFPAETQWRAMGTTLT